MKKIVLGALCALAANVAVAEVKTDVQIGDLIYSLDTESKTATITGYTGSPEKVEVSAVEDENGQKYIVTSVGEGAFFFRRSLTSVSLPNATTIGESAFAQCGSLTLVSLPNATTIGESAFNSCQNLLSVSLPNATTIGKWAFSDCGSLTSVSLPNATSIGQGAFFACGLISISLPNATTIGGQSFQNCGSLVSVYLPNATSIGGWAFFNCDKLETVIVGFGPLANPDREDWKLRDEAKLLEPFTNDEVKNATHKVAVFAGEKLIDGENYEKGCAYYGLMPKTEPQVVKEDEIAVKRESIQAAKAETVSVANNEIQLGVSVMSNANITAEIAKWGKVNLSSENVKVENGNVVITIPVSSASGFMILQSGDAKVGAGKAD